MGNSKSFGNILNKKYHFTYQTKNKVNNMLYVGRHSTDDLNDKYIGSGKLLKRAISKYGIKNFDIEILCFFDSLEELINEEMFIVNKEWCNRKDTYNISCGGSNPIMFGEDNPSWKGGLRRIKKGRPDFSGEKNPMFGKTHSPDAIEKIRKANIGKPNKYKGIKFSEDRKDYLIQFQKSCKPISFYGFHFKSIRSCSRELNISQGLVQYRIKSKNYENCFQIDKYDSNFKYNGLDLVNLIVKKK
jgi:group I intron endonuclease